MEFNIQFVKDVVVLIFILIYIPFLLISAFKIFYGKFMRSYSDYFLPAKEVKAKKIKRDYYDGPEIN